MAYITKAWHDYDPATAWSAAAAIDMETRLSAYSDLRASPMQFLRPSGDTSGATDDANFTAAVNALPHGGVIGLLADFSTPFHTATGWVLPAQTTIGGAGGGPVCLEGIGWPHLLPVGNNITGIYHHRTANFGSPQASSPFQRPSGWIRNIVVDGANATGASTGVDVGDGFAIDVDVFVKNFTGTNARGFAVVNRVFWTEKCTFKAFVINCTDHAYVGHVSSVASAEYNTLDLRLFTMPNQDGLVVDDAGFVGGRVDIRGNVAPTSATSGAPTGNAALIKLLGGSGRIARGVINASIETNPVDYAAGGGTVLPWTIYSDGQGHVYQCSGNIAQSSGTNGIKMNGAEFTFAGHYGTADYTGTLSDLFPVPTSPGGLSWTPISGGGATINGLPSSGTLAWKNEGPNAFVRLVGGTITSVSLNDVVTGITGTASLSLPAGAKLTVDYTSEPTVTVIPLNVSY